MVEPIKVFIGYDSREPELSDICAHSIARHTQLPLKFHYLKHRELRKLGWFNRPWHIRSDDGEWIDMLDNKPFSTEFSHSRFLIPALSNYTGWALFVDADMLFTSDIKNLFALAQPHYALMCVKHDHHPPANIQKMDGRLQQTYFRKNWSSFVLWNCGHAANKPVTVEAVNNWRGGDMHAFKWIKADHEIGELPRTYNYISGISPKMPVMANGKTAKPDAIHYTEGGPWFPQYKNVPLGELWDHERQHWLEDGATGYDSGIGARVA